ncbi:MAG: hypothetical protein IID38_05505 [Planctomycetes bacterium]|nr:hypothetical protein [Planctomycetota bacterium]
MTCHPSELSLACILRMDRDSILDALHEFGRHCSFHIAVETLEPLCLAELRRLLKRIRHHYHSKGY